MFDAGAVVPRTVEHHDLASGWQVLYVALEIPLATLDLGRLFQGHDAGAARVQVFHEALDRAALAGRIAPFEEDHDTLAGLLDPGLQLQKLDLEPIFLPLVIAARHQVLVGVAALAPVGGEFEVGIARLLDEQALFLDQRA